MGSLHLSEKHCIHSGDLHREEGGSRKQALLHLARVPPGYSELGIAPSCEPIINPIINEGHLRSYNARVAAQGRLLGSQCTAGP